ncbi:MAG: LuxR C-terminal-related transcriptional regulator [Myxococcota bacterium]|nr:LuxR C-terminal-related transcriptional regulator [Myxococcota bacterium]
MAEELGPGVIQENLLLPSKLYRPPLRYLVPRPRLIRRLQGRPAGKLTLVSAPAGFGKTTLVGSWVREAGHPVAWLSLDPGDNDPARFFKYLVAALQTLDTKMDQALYGMLQSFQIPLPELFMTVLVKKIADIPEPSFLVLDDYQAISSPAVHAALAFLLDHLPPQLHVVIISRTDPPFRLSRMRMQRDLVEIRAADLRFTLDETKTFLGDLNLSDEQLVALDAYTEGWVAGLQLAVLAIESSRVEGTPAKRVDDLIQGLSRYRHLMDYLTEEVLQQQPDEVRTFLLETSILDRLTAPLCDAVTERDDSSICLRQLERNNLFLLPLDDQREWYRYHPLFAEFMRRQIESPLVTKLHQRAVCWYETNGYLAEAIHHALLSENLDEAERMIERVALHTFKSGELMTLIGWLDALPEGRMRSSATLAISRAWALYGVGRFEEAAAWADIAESSERPVERGIVLCLRAILAAYGQHDSQSAIGLCEQALDLGLADLDFHSFTLCVLGEAHILAGHTQSAYQGYRRAHRLGQESRYPLISMIAVGALGYISCLIGQRRETAALCREAIKRHVDARGNPLPVAGVAHIYLGVAHYAANELDQAHHHLRLGLDLVQSGALMSYASFGLCRLAQVEYALGQKQAALETIVQARQLHTGFNAVVDRDLAAIEADFQLREGNIAFVMRWAEAERLSPQVAIDPDYWDRPYLVYARLLLAQYRLADASLLLDHLESWAREHDHHETLIATLLLQSQVHRALGDRAQASGFLRQALRLAAPQDYVRPFVEMPSVVELLPQVRSIAPVFVDALVSVLKHQPIKSSGPLYPTGGHASWPLSVREIQVLGLVATGKSNREIAQELFVTVGAIKKHLSNIFGKLDVHRRTQAVARARELSLLP